MTHKNIVGKISVPVRIRLKPDAQHLTQRPSNYNTIKQIGFSPDDKPTYGTIFLNPLIIIPKGDSIKCVLDARHLNANTELTNLGLLNLLLPNFHAQTKNTNVQ